LVPSEANLLSDEVGASVWHGPDRLAEEGCVRETWAPLRTMEEERSW
jgi:hypothetical protein